jgi:hypothetical protein
MYTTSGSRMRERDHSRLREGDRERSRDMIKLIT